ncbi:MAG: hypothetical protein EPN99_05310 [Frankiales bacterium]|nr:MAG: hypothetical protein EPN99_05310 [Frankiales bacterium]
MKRLLAAAGVLSVIVAAGPAVAAPAKHGACKAPAGAVLVKPGTESKEVVATPVGALNLTEDEVGTYVLDLSGKPAASRGKLTFTLSWANPASDYDLVVNGVNELSTDNPEVTSVKASHCRAVKVGIAVFTGVPVDELTLAAKGA